MATKAELRTKFIARMRRRDVTSTLADGFLDDAVLRVQRVLRVPALESSVEATISDATYFDNGSELLLPVDLLGIRTVTVVDAAGAETVLERRDIDYVLRSAFDEIGVTPRYFARRGPALVFAPTPVDGTDIRIDYYADAAELTNDDDENIISTIAPDLIIYGALTYACDHFSDTRGPKFEERFQQILADLTGQAQDDELTASAVVTPAYTYPNEDGLA